MNKTEVFEDLYKRIISGELNPGQWLVERELCESYGISRTPIREILGRLNNLNLVVIEHSKGYQIKKLTLKEVVEIFNAREAIEGSAARFACNSNAADFHSKIHELRGKLESLNLQDGGPEGVAVGNEVHAFLIEKANNRFLHDFSLKLSGLMFLTRNITKHNSHIEEKSRIDHLKILDALESRKADLCEELMRTHLRTTCKSITENYYNNLVIE